MLANRNKAAQHQTKDSCHVDNFTADFLGAPSVAEAEAIVVQSLLVDISMALSIPSKDIDVSKRLFEFGVDSLLGVELRNKFGKRYGADIAVFDIMGENSIVAVGALVTSRSKLRLSQ